VSSTGRTNKNNTKPSDFTSCQGYPVGGVFIMENTNIPISEKYTLSIKEASAYFSIGVKKMRRLAEENVGRFSVYSGNRYLIIRTKFETFINESSAV